MECTECPFDVLVSLQMVQNQLIPGSASGGTDWFWLPLRVDLANHHRSFEWTQRSCPYSSEVIYTVEVTNLLDDSRQSSGWDGPRTPSWSTTEDKKKIWGNPKESWTQICTPLLISALLLIPTNLKIFQTFAQQWSPKAGGIIFAEMKVNDTLTELTLSTSNVSFVSLLSGLFPRCVYRSVPWVDRELRCRPRCFYFADRPKRVTLPSSSVPLLLSPLWTEPPPPPVRKGFSNCQSTTQSNAPNRL